MDSKGPGDLASHSMWYTLPHIFPTGLTYGSLLLGHSMVLHHVLMCCLFFPFERLRLGEYWFGWCLLRGRWGLVASGKSILSRARPSGAQSNHRSCFPPASLNSNLCTGRKGGHKGRARQYTSPEEIDAQLQAEKQKARVSTCLSRPLLWPKVVPWRGQARTTHSQKPA